MCPSKNVHEHKLPLIKGVGFFFVGGEFNPTKRLLRRLNGNPPLSFVPCAHGFDDL